MWYKFIKITILIAIQSSLLFGNDATGSKKINGISLVGGRDVISESALQPMVSVNANWVALIPFAFGVANKTSLYYNSSFQWWGEKKEGICKTIEYAKNNNLNVMLKPQVWFKGGFYVGHYDLLTEADWLEWENNFSNYILDYAHLADSMQVNLFCIGTEFTIFCAKRPNYWANLIKQVRVIYKGQITYASNWDAYEKFPHWDKVDFIGIDAYFPLSNKNTPSVNELIKKWNVHFKAINQFQSCYEANVIFTEFGYRNIDKNTLEPWASDNKSNVNNAAQVNALRAVFQKFWNQNWFDGGFIWNWYANHKTAGGNNNTDFTPQNKPAQQVIQNWYGRYK